MTQCRYYALWQYNYYVLWQQVYNVIMQYESRVNLQLLSNIFLYLHNLLVNTADLFFQILLRKHTPILLLST